MKIVFMGSPSFSILPLEHLLDQGPSRGLEVVAVVSQPSKPQGRNLQPIDPPLAVFAKSRGLITLQPAKASEPNFLSDLEKLAPDVIITCAYGQILSKDFLAVPRRATINIHPSALPKYRGASPLQAALLDGLSKTSVSILFTVHKLDAGPLILQEEFKVEAYETAPSLGDRLFKLSGPLLLKALDKLKDPFFVGTPQDEAQVSFCKKISKEDGLILWEQSREEIMRKFCAYTPWPGSFTHLGERRLKIEGLSVQEEALPLGSPGSMSYEKQQKVIKVATQDSYVRIDRLTPQGGRSLTAEQFWNGLSPELRSLNLK
ncbi:MAG: methionyl-tRNA formyltransferase [Oligoflexales bacterium]|nr:methionyl-tRNA formyltransferase [Oligoflexales bacterium]